MIPLLHHFLSEFEDRFNDISRRAAQILHLIPAVICSQRGVDLQLVEEVVELYRDDLPSSDVVAAETHLWQVKWQDKDVPNTAVKARPIFFPKHSLPFAHILFNVRNLV